MMNQGPQKITMLIVLLASSQLFGQANNVTDSPTNVMDRPVSLKLLAPNLLHDQKNIWTFPARLGKSRNWIPAAVVLGTAALFATEVDAREAPYFRKTDSFKRFNKIFNGKATEVGTLAVPASLYAFGLIGNDSKMRQTALLAGEAVLDSEILTTILKDATKRASPMEVPIHGNFSGTWWDGHGNALRGEGSFPSGHTISAFSVATVIARRYGNHRWVPVAAYSAAALVGFSRLTLSAHYLSDVFVGAALGYSISRFTVLHE